MRQDNTNLVDRHFNRMSGLNLLGRTRSWGDRGVVICSKRHRGLGQEDERFLDVGVPLHVLDRALAPECAPVFREGETKRERESE
jgi:hypothetical protein